MGYDIEYHDVNRQVVSIYKNFQDDIPSTKRCLQLLKASQNPSLAVYSFKNDEKVLEIYVKRMGYKDLIGVSKYCTYVPQSIIDRALNTIAPTKRKLMYSIVVEPNGKIHSAYYDFGNTLVKSATYKNNNLHGSQLFEYKSSLYTLNFKHGRIMEMFVYTGKLFSFGTKLVPIEIQDDVVKALANCDRQIRNSIKII